MRAGILIIGSLLWRQTGGRAGWRRARLSVEDALRVKVPIRYGRKSDGGTYTMTFAARGELGTGVVVPCRTAIQGIHSLIEEAEALWKAERPDAQGGEIARKWGCVGVLFRDVGGCGELRRGWSLHFQRHARPVRPVGVDGLLRTPWPASIDDGGPVDLDVILATATKREPRRPTPNEIARAWLDNGREDYFFENVQNGIRTPDDLAIWKAIEHGKPHWLGKADYVQAVKTLRDEASASTC